MYANASSPISIPLSGREVTCCSVANTFSLEMWEGEGNLFLIQINVPFEFNDGRENRVLEISTPDRLGPALSVVRTKMVSATVASDGTLSLRFSSGATIAVKPHMQYEAWEVSGPKGLRWLCVAGGEIVTWS